MDCSNEDDTVKNKYRLLNPTKGFINFINSTSNFHKPFLNTAQFHKPFAGLLFFPELSKVYYLCHRLRVYKTELHSKGFMKLINPFVVFNILRLFFTM